MDELKWISVEDRLPEPFKPVLVAYNNGTVDLIGWQNWKNDGEMSYRDDEAWENIVTVTHWMPLPMPPKKEANRGGKKNESD